MGRHAWLVLSYDKGILRKPAESGAVMAAGLGLFVLVGGDAPAGQIARNVVNTLPKIERFLDDHPRPFIAKIYRPSPVSDVDRGVPGRVEIKLPRPMSV